MEKEENILGTEKIGKLIRKFSIPCIISLLVNSLYNIVDQVFIGHIEGVGTLANGATNVVFPLTMIALALSLMFGDGSSAYLSLKLGEKKKDEAARGVGNGICLSVISALGFTIITIIFLPQLLNLFGCTDNLREYAIGYGRIIAFGLPFFMIGTTLNSIIRSDGSPKYSMISMVSGAILNIILDPIFIFVLDMGIEGAALATIISQFVTFLLNILYVRRFKTITLNKDKLKLKFSVSKKVTMLGVSSFITQMSYVFVASTVNNLLGKYGVDTKYGSDIPIAVVGIVMKISQIIYSIVLGIAVGTQPIFGYNYGARKFDRVKKALKIMLSLSVVVTIIAFILFQTIPDKLILIFGNGDSNYIEFACMTFRIYLMLVVCNGIQIQTGIFFQAIGKSSRSAILSLSRQIVFLLPAMIILSSIMGITGVLWAGPVADGIAFLIAVTLLLFEVKNLSKINNKSNTLEDDTSTDKKINEHIVITISREYGSGGRYVGRLIADKLGIKFYDKELVAKVAEETGLSEEYIESHEQKRTALNSLNSGYYAGLDNSDELFIKESDTIQKIADEESCVIIGRCADFILKDRKDVIKVFIYSSMEDKLKRATEIYNMNKAKAEKEINRINKLRANHYKHYTERNWNDAENYDICINSDTLGVEKTADLICEIINRK